MNNQVIGRNAARGVSALESMPHRAKFRVWPMTLFAASFAVAWIPGIGPFLSHGLDRMKNRSDTNYEIDVRAKYYAEQIGTTLGMSPDRVRGSDLLQAASMNPALRRVVEEVKRKEGDENRSSAFINTGVGVAGMVGLGGAAKIAGEAVTAAKAAHTGVQVAKQVAGSLAGGALAGVLSKDEINSQELIEATEKDMERAKAQGLDVRAAFNPQISFMIRLAQDPEQNKAVNKLSKERFGSKFHKLDTQQMSAIMDSFPELADKALVEARGIAEGRTSIRTLAATEANMTGDAVGPMTRSDNVGGGFVAKEMARRAKANAVNDNGREANDNGMMSHSERIRMQEATRAANRGVTA